MFPAVSPSTLSSRLTLVRVFAAPARIEPGMLEPLTEDGYEAGLGRRIRLLPIPRRKVELLPAEAASGSVPDFAVASTAPSEAWHGADRSPQGPGRSSAGCMT